MIEWIVQTIRNQNVNLISMLFLIVGILSLVLLMVQPKILQKYDKSILIVGVSFYMLFIVSITIIQRNDYYLENLRPFPLQSYYDIIVLHKYRFIIDNALNILLFIPIGAFFIFFNIPTISIACFSVLLEVSIELAQFFSYRGVFETDDIIHGLVGTLIGAFLTKFYLNKRKNA